VSGPLPGVLAPIAWPASRLYAAAIRVRNARYDAGRGVQSIGVPVISVGNLSVGGTGKSPVVRWIVQRLRDHGVEPVIAMRGYAAPPGGGPGDEQREHEHLLGDVPVVAAPDRVAALTAYLAGHPSTGCVVLDDGFQHRRLARDLDLVLIDATRDTVHDRVLPLGWLREPAASLRRADAVVVTRAAGVDGPLAAAIERLHGRPPLAWSRHAWAGLERHDRGGATREPVSWLAGRRIVTMLGVGHPDAVRRQAEAAGAVIVADVPARDHEAYDRPKVALARGLCEGVDALLLTSKDWVKAVDLIDLETWPTPIVVPRLELEVFEGAAALEGRILEAVKCPS